MTKYQALDAGDRVVLVGTESEWKTHYDPMSDRATWKPGMLGIATQCYPETTDADAIVRGVAFANGKTAAVRRQFLAKVPAAGTVLRIRPGCDGSFDLEDCGGLPKGQIADGTEVVFVGTQPEGHCFAGQFKVEGPNGPLTIDSKWLEIVREPEAPKSDKPQILILGDEDVLADLLPKLDGRGLAWADGRAPSQYLPGYLEGLLIDYKVPGSLLNVQELAGRQLLGIPTGVLVANARSLSDNDLDRLFGPAKQTIRITRSWLDSKRACEPEIDWFVETFGGNASVAPEAVKAALKPVNPAWLDWLESALRK